MAVSLGRSPAADPCGPEMPGAVHVTNWDSYRLPFDGDPVDVAIRCANEFEVAIKHNGPESVAADDCGADLGGGGDTHSAGGVLAAVTGDCGRV